jgi:hypothetical protein
VALHDRDVVGMHIYGRMKRTLLIGAAALLRDNLTGIHPELRAVARKARPRLAPV